jgi:RNA polymerase sigma-B factor
VSQRLKQRNGRVQENMALVRQVAAHYAARSAEPFDDLAQVGALGLIRAAELYSSSRCVPFTAFAAPHVRGSVLHYLRDVAPLVRISRRLQERRQQVEQCRLTIWRKEGRSPSGQELQQRLGLNRRQWEELQGLGYVLRHLTLDALDVDEPPVSVHSASDEASADPMAALQGLDPRLRRVVDAVVLKGESLRTVAARQGCSAATVHRQLHRALGALRLQLSRASDVPAC